MAEYWTPKKDPVTGKIIPITSAEIAAMAKTAPKKRRDPAYARPAGPSPEVVELAAACRDLGAKIEAEASELRGAVALISERAAALSDVAAKLLSRARALTGEAAPVPAGRKQPRFLIKEPEGDSYDVVGWTLLAEALGWAENTARAQMSAHNGRVVNRSGIVATRL